VAQIEQLLAEDGFSGLNLDGFGTFPTIVLNDGAFRYSGGEEIGPEFIVRIMSSRAKFLYKTDLPDSDPRGEVAYSYDNATNTNGTPLEDIFDGWRQKGLPVKNTPVVYTEVQGQMDDGKVVLLSIPKTSSSVLGAYLVQLRMNGKKGSDVWTRCFKGPTVTRAVKPFTPWAFSVAS
jgi:hypothetical protein